MNIQKFKERIQGSVENLKHWVSGSDLPQIQNYNELIKRELALKPNNHQVRFLAEFPDDQWNFQPTVFGSKEYDRQIRQLIHIKNTQKDVELYFRTPNSEFGTWQPLHPPQRNPLLPAYAPDDFPLDRFVQKHGWELVDRTPNRDPIYSKDLTQKDFDALTAVETNGKWVPMQTIIDADFPAIRVGSQDWDRLDYITTVLIPIRKNPNLEQEIWNSYADRADNRARERDFPGWVLDPNLPANARLTLHAPDVQMGPEYSVPQFAIEHKGNEKVPKSIALGELDKFIALHEQIQPETAKILLENWRPGDETLFHPGLANPNVRLYHQTIEKELAPSPRPMVPVYDIQPNVQLAGFGPDQKVIFPPTHFGSKDYDYQLRHLDHLAQTQGVNLHYRTQDLEFQIFKPIRPEQGLEPKAIAQAKSFPIELEALNTGWHRNGDGTLSKEKLDLRIRKLEEDRFFVITHRDDPKKPRLVGDAITFVAFTREMPRKLATEEMLKEHPLKQAQRTLSPERPSPTMGRAR